MTENEDDMAAMSAGAEFDDSWAEYGWEERPVDWDERVLSGDVHPPPSPREQIGLVRMKPSPKPGQPALPADFYRLRKP